MIQTAYVWLRSHPEIMSAVVLGIYHVSSAFVGSLEMPDATSSKFYRFFFTFTNRLAANYSRAGAAKTINGPTKQNT